jgi:hypothetical protein
VVKDISNIYLICVANILENSEKMELYQKKYSLYKKAKELTQKYAQKIHGVF